jgi:hypothetical protein
LSNDEIDKENKPKKKDVDLYWLFKYMTRVIKLEVPYLEKSWSPIPNKSNVKWWNQEKKSIT